MSRTKWIRGSLDDPCVCPTNEPVASPLSGVGYGCEIVGWSPDGRGSRVGADSIAEIRVDVLNGGGVGVDMVGVMVGFGVVEFYAGVGKRVLFFFSRPLPLPTISKTNIYNN